MIQSIKDYLLFGMSRNNNMLTTAGKGTTGWGGGAPGARAPPSLPEINSLH